jgi:hypothetical protein
MRRKREKPCERCAPPRASFRGGRGKPRELSVRSLYRPSEHVGEEAVPFRRISGRRLEQLGFAKGSRVVVSGEQGRLTLTVADPGRCR